MRRDFNVCNIGSTCKHLKHTHVLHNKILKPVNSNIAFITTAASVPTATIPPMHNIE